ncbi:hypothetical protein AMTRI_Chr10g6540 [Amborella trichopoda]
MIRMTCSIFMMIHVQYFSLALVKISRPCHLCMRERRDGGDDMFHGYGDALVVFHIHF